MLALLLGADGGTPVTQAVTFDSFTVLLLMSLVIPVITGIVVKSGANATWKQVITLVLSAIAGLITTATQLDGTAVISKESALNAALSLGIAITTYLGIYRPHNLNDGLAPTKGLG